MLSPNDIIVVEHKGTSLPMTAIQYKSCDRDWETKIAINNTKE